MIFQVQFFVADEELTFKGNMAELQPLLLLF